MNPEEIVQDRAILAAATKGPWAHGAGRRTGDREVEVLAPDGSEIATCWPDKQAENAAAIAHAVNRLPAYIAEVEEITRRIATIQILCDAAGERGDYDESFGLAEAIRVLRGAK